jgi:energy-coupling factor transporter transmembrane protein EcfT
MRNSNRRPNWWILYAIAALFILVFVVEAALPLSETVQRSLEIIITLLFYSLVWMWLNINRQFLAQEDQQRERHRRSRFLKTNAAKPTPPAGILAVKTLPVMGILKTVCARISAIALAIYGFFQS